MIILQIVQNSQRFLKWNVALVDTFLEEKVIESNEEITLNIEVMAFDEKLKPLAVKQIEADPNFAAQSAGETVELFLRRKDVKVKYILIKKV